jgi:predicted phage tail component-like protein
MNVHIESGLYQESFLANRSINEIKIKGRSEPYFQNIEDSPISLKLTFAFEDSFDTEKIRAVARALKKDFYFPLVFSQNPDRIFYAICVDESQLIHTGLGTGYITVNFRCNAPWSYSPTFSSPLYDLTSNPIEGTSIQFINNGDLPITPIITVQIISGSTFSIQNISNGGQTISFTGLQVNEILTIDDDQNITTDVPLTWRYSNMTGDFLEILRGVNNLLILGNIKLQFTYENKILQS